MVNDPTERMSKALDELGEAALELLLIERKACCELLVQAIANEEALAKRHGMDMSSCSFYYHGADVLRAVLICVQGRGK